MAPQGSPARSHRRLRARGAALAAAVAAIAIAVAGCGAGGEGSDATGSGPLVVTTTPVVADLVRNVAGRDARVVQLLPANADPHDYEVRPRDVEAVAGAAVVVRSGGDVDGWLDDALGAAGGSPEVVTLLGAVHQRRVGDRVDPHWWQDPRNAVEAVRRIAGALEHAVPARARAIAADAARYERAISRLDRAIARCMDSIPPARRTLVTTHDAFGYYAGRYGVRIVGTVIPSLSTAGQPSAGSLSRLVETIRRTRTTTVFAESSVNQKVEQAIAREAGARVGPPLYADTLGPPGSPGATYLSALSFNTRAMASAFGGHGRACRLPAEQ